MKKQKLNISKKLTLSKETITSLNDKVQLAINGGITGKVCGPVSGTGCGCDPQASCGIVLCTAFGCDTKTCAEALM